MDAEEYDMIRELQSAFRAERDAERKAIRKLAEQEQQRPGN